MTKDQLIIVELKKFLILLRNKASLQPRFTDLQEVASRTTVITVEAIEEHLRKIEEVADHA